MGHETHHRPPHRLLAARKPTGRRSSSCRRCLPPSPLWVMSHPQKLKDDVRLEDQRHAVVGRNFESVTLSTIPFIATKKEKRKTEECQNAYKTEVASLSPQSETPFFVVHSDISPGIKTNSNAQDPCFKTNLIDVICTSLSSEDASCPLITRICLGRHLRDAWPESAVMT